jgi:hypothetical protein
MKFSVFIKHPHVQVDINDATREELNSIPQQFFKNIADPANFTDAFSADNMAKVGQAFVAPLIGEELRNAAEAERAIPPLVPFAAIATGSADFIGEDNGNRRYLPIDGPIPNDKTAFDKSGMPWDKRIHSSAKSVNKDGSWKKRKGAEAAEIAAVEAELRAASVPQQPTIPPAPVAAPAPQAVVYDASQAAAATVAVESQIPAHIEQAMQPQPVAAPVAHVLPQPATPTGPTFQSLTQRITQGFALGKIDGTYMPTICQRLSAAFGQQVNAITDIQNNPTMVKYANDCIDVDNKGF